MKRIWFIAILLLSIAFFSCSEAPTYSEPDIKVEEIQKVFSKWWAYHYNNINLSGNFIALDHASNVISKESFLKQLTTGNYIPVKLTATDTLTYYKLYQLSKQADPSIGTTIKNTSSLDYAYFQMEGKEFPQFNLTDLHGTEYTNENTKGKLLVVKCWFIACVPCVEEMPKLNTLVKQYSHRKDILFFSLATDTEEELRTFLNKKPFAYAVIAGQQTFIADSLRIGQYPTHIIVNKNGRIVKVVSRYKDLSMALQSEIDKKVGQHQL